jgi:hypothetical protein
VAGDRLSTTKDFAELVFGHDYFVLLPSRVTESACCLNNLSAPSVFLRPFLLKSFLLSAAEST